MKLVVIAALFCLAFGQTLYLKHPQGPPSEFGNYDLPKPEETALTSSATQYDIQITSPSNSWTQSLPVDSNTEFSIGISSPVEGKFTVTIKAPSGTTFDPIQSIASSVLTDNLGVDGAQFPVTTYIFEGEETGVWQINVALDTSSMTEQDLARYVDSNLPEGLLIVGSTSQYESFAHLTDLADLLGNNIGMQVRLYDTLVALSEGQIAPTAIVASTITANALVGQPNGVYIDLPMHDDGLHNDLAANDGVYGVEVTIGEVGYYSARITMQGTLANGAPFSRSTEHIFYAVADTVDLFGSATASVNTTENMLNIFVDAKVQTFDNVSTPGMYRVYGEFWGMDHTGNQVPIAWVGGLSLLSPTTLQQTSALNLQLSLDWIHHAQATAPFFLKNFRVQDVQTSTPIDLDATIAVNIDLENIETLHTLQPISPKGTISSEMRKGKMPAHISSAVTKLQSGAISGKLVLLHGYCSEGNPWPTQDFPNALFYTYGSAASLSNFDFATSVLQYMEKNNVQAASGIGHSQGGPVLVTMLANFWSPLDATIEAKVSGNVVQSAGSPYQGCTLAGSISNLGGIFGVGCGSNTDLSTQGASVWLKTLALEDKKQMHYWYTTYGSAGYCNSVVNWVANKPNDGTTEEKYATLPDAVGEGKASNLCHISGMQYPPQTSDAAHNKVLYNNQPFK